MKALAILVSVFTLLLVGCNEEEVNALKEQNASILKDKATLEEKIGNLEKEFGTLQAENSALEEKLAAATGKVTELEESLTENATQLEAVTKNRDELKAEVAKVAEAEEKKQQELNKYSHEALGDNPTREQLLALFDAYETIAKDAPDVLEKIIQEATLIENLVNRGQFFLKGKFKPYTGWTISHDLKSDEPSKTRSKYPRLFAHNYLTWWKDGRRHGISYGMNAEFGLKHLSIRSKGLAIRTKAWYPYQGFLSYDILYKETGLDDRIPGGIDGLILEAKSWLNKIENGVQLKCPMTDFNDGHGTFVKYTADGDIDSKISYSDGLIATRERYFGNQRGDKFEYAQGYLKKYTSYSGSTGNIYEVETYDVEKLKILDQQKDNALDKALISTTYYEDGKPSRTEYFKDGVKIEK